MSIKSLFAVVSSLAALGLASGAHAAPSAVDRDAGTVRISVADLDLNRPADGRVALQRIRSAADELCNGAPQITDLPQARVYRACVADVVDHTLAAVDSPILTALNAGAPVPELTASR